MRAYLITTGLLFGVLALLHIWRMDVEWPREGTHPLFIFGMGALVLLPGALSWWAWVLLRKLSNQKADARRKEP
jgi:hypothetical protein